MRQPARATMSMAWKRSTWRRWTTCPRCWGQLVYPLCLTRTRLRGGENSLANMDRADRPRIGYPIRISARPTFAPALLPCGTHQVSSNLIGLVERWSGYAKSVRVREPKGLDDHRLHRLRSIIVSNFILQEKRRKRISVNPCERVGKFIHGHATPLRLWTYHSMLL